MPAEFREQRNIIRESETRPVIVEKGQSGFEAYLNEKQWMVDRSYKRPDGDYCVDVSVAPGRYDVSVGFTSVDPKDKRFFYGNFPKEKQKERSLILDVESKEFIELSRRFKAGEKPGENFPEKIRRLKRFIEENFSNDSEDENIFRLSDILKKRKSACAGLSLISVLLLNGEKNLLAREIDGLSYKVPVNNGVGKKPHNINHAWTRISNGREIALYDPFFRRLEFYTSGAIEIKPNDPFAGYEVEIKGLAQIISGVRASYSRTGVKVLEAQGGGKSAYLGDERSHLDQILGAAQFLVQLDETKKITLVNGGFESSRSVVTNAPRILNPINMLVKR